MEYTTLEVSVDKDSVATIRLNRPDRRNAMNPKLHEEMTHALEALRYDDAAKVIVITGNGPAFCAGMDLKEFFLGLRNDDKEFDRVYRLAMEWRYRTLRYYPKVTIASVNGYCFGGAFSIVEGCDLAIAAEDAVFGLSEINFNIFPGGSVSKSIANLLRPRDALWYSLTGEPFTGKEAVAVGFINRCYPAAELGKRTQELAASLAKKDPAALQATKEGYHYSREMSADASFNFTLAKFVEMGVKQKQGKWADEGIGDFLKGEYKPGLGGRELVQKP